MTTTLVWQVKPKSNYRSLPFQLRQVLEKRYKKFPKVVSAADIDYLSGLRDAGIEGAQELIELIDEYEEIEINIEQ